MRQSRKKFRKDVANTSSSRWIPRTAYYGKTDETRQKQLANLHPRRKTQPQNTDYSSLDSRTLSKMDIIEFASILGISFKERPAQEVTLRAMYGLPMDEEQLRIFKELTQRKGVYAPGEERLEASWAIGARGGKSYLVSIIALYETICRGKHWRKYLNKGEVGYAVIIATKLKQAEDIIQKNCARLLEESKLSFWKKDVLRSRLPLKNGLEIASYPCNTTAARGVPIFLLIFDEIAHFRTEGPKADETIMGSLRPRQAQFPGAKCLKFSTPAAKQGIFWTEFDEGFDVPGRLTIQAPTRLMNPLIDQEFIDKEYKYRPDNAEREFGAQFAETVSGFFASQLEKLKEAFQLAEDVPFQPGNIYYGAIDQSGLAGRDRFAFSIAHNEPNKTVQDITRQWDTKDIDLIMAEIKQLCAIYGIYNVSVDQYAKGYVESDLNSVGLQMTVRQALPLIYQNLKTLVITSKVSLQDNPAVRLGLMQTQGYYGKSNKLTIAHERTREGHGDAADATASAVYDASKNLTIGQLTQTVKEKKQEKFNSLEWGLRGPRRRRVSA